MGNVKRKGSLGCSAREIVEFKTLMPARRAQQAHSPGLLGGIGLFKDLIIAGKALEGRGA